MNTQLIAELGEQLLHLRSVMAMITQVALDKKAGMVNSHVLSLNSMTALSRMDCYLPDPVFHGFLQSLFTERVNALTDKGIDLTEELYKWRQDMLAKGIDIDKEF